MGFKFDNSINEMTIIEILNGSKKDIRENMDLLAKVYLEKTGRKVCRTCPSDIQYMILSLKHALKMAQFKFKRHAAQYKNKKGDKVTISNGNMADEKAIEFLRTKPERINLFSEYPSNWKELIGGKVETDKEKEARLAAEAEAQKVADEKARLAAEDEKEKPAIDTDTEKVIAEEMEAATDGKEAEEKVEETKAEEVIEPEKKVEEKLTKADLMKLSMKELRERFPEVKARSITEFVEEALAK